MSGLHIDLCPTFAPLRTGLDDSMIILQEGDSDSTPQSSTGTEFAFTTPTTAMSDEHCSSAPPNESGSEDNGTGSISHATTRSSPPSQPHFPPARNMSKLTRHTSEERNIMTAYDVSLSSLWRDLYQDYEQIFQYLNSIGCDLLPSDASRTREQLPSCQIKFESTSHLRRSARQRQLRKRLHRRSSSAAPMLSLPQGGLFDCQPVVDRLALLNQAKLTIRNRTEAYDLLRTSTISKLSNYLGGSTNGEPLQHPTYSDYIACSAFLFITAVTNMARRLDVPGEGFLQVTTSPNTMNKAGYNGDTAIVPPSPDKDVDDRDDDASFIASSGASSSPEW